MILYLYVRGKLPPTPRRPPRNLWRLRGRQKIPEQSPMCKCGGRLTNTVVIKIRPSWKRCKSGIPGTLDHLFIINYSDNYDRNKS